MVTQSRHQSGDFVGQGDGRQERSAVRLAVDGGEARHRLRQRGKSGTVGIRAVLTKSGDAGDHQPRLRSCMTSGPTPSRSMVPVRKFYQHVGVSAQRQQLMPTLVGLQVDRDDALAAAQVLPPQGEAISRVAPSLGADGVAAGPLFMTSAPKSARYLLHCGPATTVEQSTTFRSASGRGRSVEDNH